MKRLEEYEIYKSWKNNKGNEKFWDNLFSNNIDKDIFVCGNRTFEYLEKLQDIPIEIYFILPIIIRSIKDVKNFNIKYYNVERMIDIIIKELPNKVQYYENLKLPKFDFEAEACADMAKEITKRYKNILRENKLNFY